MPKVTIRGSQARKDFLDIADHHHIGISRRFFNETAAINKRNPDIVHVMKIATE